MALLDLISQGGTGIPSPAQRFIQTKRQVAGEDRNRLSELATRQSLDIQQKQETRAEGSFQAKQQQDFAKAVTPLVEQINQQPDKQRAYEAALPQMDQIARQFGVDTRTFSAEFDQDKADSLIAQFGKKDKGQFKQMVDTKGKPVQGRIVNGRVFDRDNKPRPDLSVAPTKQETGKPGAFTKSGKNKLEIEAFNAEEGVYKITNNLNDLKKLVNSPDFIGGTTGDIIGSGNSMVQQFRQFTGLGEFENGGIPEKDVENKEGEFSTLRKAAISGGRRESLIIELAYNIAKSFDKGGRVTDADFKFARNVIEGSADRAGTIAKIDDFMKRKQADYTASDALLSEKIPGRQASPFTDERYRELYNIPAQQDSPTTDVDKLKSDLFTEFGIQ